MKYIIIFLILFISSCNSIAVKNSREKLLKYEVNGYSIKLDDSLIKFKRIFLDEEKIKQIKINRSSKLVSLARSNSNFNIVPLTQICETNSIEDLVIIDGYLIETKLIDSTSIEMSSIKKVTILKDGSMLFGKNFRKIIVITTN